MHGDRMAVFQSAQLFQRFESLQRALRQHSKLPQKAGTIGIETNMVQRAHVRRELIPSFVERIACPGDWRSGKIEGIARGIAYDFDHVRVEQSFRRSDAA